jgi:adenylate kinase family enzyme
MPPQKVLVYGVTGSGKSTLAARIGNKLGIPYHSVDDLAWEPGWVEVPKPTQRDRITAICGQDEWVIDSAYGSWLDIPLAHVDLIVGLDYPRWTSLRRLINRSVMRWRRKTVICNGNVESLRALVARDSILVWHFKSFKNKQRRMRAWAGDPNGPTVLLFRSPRETEAWLEHELVPTEPQPGRT